MAVECGNPPTPLSGMRQRMVIAVMIGSTACGRTVGIGEEEREEPGEPGLRFGGKGCREYGDRKTNHRGGGNGKVGGGTGMADPHTIAGNGRSPFPGLRLRVCVPRSGIVIPVRRAVSSIPDCMIKMVRTRIYPRRPSHPRKEEERRQQKGEGAAGRRSLHDQTLHGLNWLCFMMHDSAALRNPGDS